MGCNINGCNMNRVFAMRALQTQLSIDFISVELTTERIMVGIAKIEVRRNHLPHSPAAGRLVHRDEIHMALLQLWEDSFECARGSTGGLLLGDDSGRHADGKSQTQQSTR